MYITLIFLKIVMMIDWLVEETTCNVERWDISHGDTKCSQGECCDSVFICLVMYITDDFDDFHFIYVYIGITYIVI